MAQRVDFNFWLMTPAKMAAEPKLKYHRNPLFHPRRMIYFLLGKVEVKVDPEVKVRSRSPRSWIELVRSGCISVY